MELSLPDPLFCYCWRLTMADSKRLARLFKVFDNVCSGSDRITKQNARLFLEAIYTQSDAVNCVERLCARDQTGLRALQAALFSETSTDFFNDPFSKLCTFLSTPTLSNIHDGQYLGRVIKHVLCPTVFWNAILDAFKQGTLNLDGEVAFGWLLVQVLTAPPPELDNCADYHAAADDSSVVNRLLKSISPIARSHGSKIVHLRKTPGAGDDEAGGRHDNDHADFRKIAILPTPDELGSLQPPFLRHATYLDDDENVAGHPPIHLDNQFRLLREDMLSEIREETQIALGKKKGWHRGLALQVSFAGLFIPESRAREKVGIRLRCTSDLWQFKGVSADTEKRKEYLEEHKNIVKHLSLACLIANGQILSFPTLFRVVDLLAQQPPVVVVGLDDEELTAKTLLALKTSPNLKLVSINCAVFFYQPVLTALQHLLPSQLALQEELLHWHSEMPLEKPVSFPYVQSLIWDLLCDPLSLQSQLSLKNPVKLDVSQSASFVASLQQRLSLVQGPPGEFCDITCSRSGNYFIIIIKELGNHLSEHFSQRHFMTKPKRRFWLFATPTMLSTSFSKIFSRSGSHRTISRDLEEGPTL